MELRNIVLYVSGPYSGLDEDAIDVNIKKAGKIAQQLWDEGFTVFCPHTNTAHFSHESTPYEGYIEGDLVLVARCDAIVMIEDWQKSKGALIEKERAELLNLPVFDLETQSIKDIKDFYAKKLSES